jgi:hypothetical protein
MEEENFVPRVYNFINGEFYETEKTAHSIDPATLKPIADSKYQRYEELLTK